VSIANESAPLSLPKAPSSKRVRFNINTISGDISNTGNTGANRHCHARSYTPDIRPITMFIKDKDVEYLFGVDPDDNNEDDNLLPINNMRFY
jgi:hypothetical protein